MEPILSFSDQESQCYFSRMLSNVDDDFMLPQLHDHELFSNDHANNGIDFESSIMEPFGSFSDKSLFSSSELLNTNSCQYFSQDMSNSIGNNFSFNSMEFCAMDKIDHIMAQFFTDDVMDDLINEKDDTLGNADYHPMAIVQSSNQDKLKRKLDAPEDSFSNETFEINPKKKSRLSRDTQKVRKNTQPKKNKKTLQGCINEDDNETNGGQNMEISSPSMSEDGSHELCGGEISDSKGSPTLNSNGKTRAKKGFATDSQSLYARKRRERINERLRTLQNLVPNGTKVDISTMLEEAVNYVKFLQLQIKLLSSDDLWMYAPIAYNGMDIGAYQKGFN